MVMTISIMNIMVCNNGFGRFELVDGASEGNANSSMESFITYHSPVDISAVQSPQHFPPRCLEHNCDEGERKQQERGKRKRCGRSGTKVVLRSEMDGVMGQNFLK